MSRRHQSLTDRIRLVAQGQGQDPQRLRRSVVFQRVLARLAPHGLVLKGGYCLEARLGGLARATKDLDLVGRLATTSDAEDLADLLDDMLDRDDIDDGFAFRPLVPRDLRSRGDQRAWRVTVEALIDGAPFERIRLDLVGQVEEVRGGTEVLTLPSPLAVDGHRAVEVLAVDVFQHAAEKYHAYSRMYAQDRPSSRVKDLVDLVLLVEAGLLMDPARLAARLHVVWSARDGTDPPSRLPKPPADWEAVYRRFATDLDLTARSPTRATAAVAVPYTAALTEGTTA